MADEESGKDGEEGDDEEGEDEVEDEDEAGGEERDETEDQLGTSIEGLEEEEHVSLEDLWEDTESWGVEDEGIDEEDERKELLHREHGHPLKSRGRSVYDLGSSFIGSTAPSFIEGGYSDYEFTDKIKKPRMTVALGMSGIARLNLSELTQKIMGCVVGENVTTEYPWIYVKKEIIEDNIDLHDESSDFLPVKDEIHEFPDTKILIGYAPSSVEKGQFYVCMTEAARDAVIEHIDALRAEQENRVRNAVYKTVGFWTSLGSEYDVSASIVKNSRPLYEIEVESTSDLLNLPMNFIDRGADDQRDGYVELTPYRQTFENVASLMVTKGEQTTPAMMDNEAQTDPSFPNNMWTQYQYEYPVINTEAYNEDEANAMKEFLDKYTDEICDQVNVNATWDIYMNDYLNLVRSERDIHPPTTVQYTEHQCYSDGKLCKDKVINSLSWHPLWSGIAAATYTDLGKSQRLVGPRADDEVLRACHGDNQVFLWSFTDCLSPKLILISPREVTSVSFCPYDGNVIIGGCANGQVAIWNIPGKIGEVEAVVVRTTAQVKYRIAMKSLMTWMQESKGSSTVTPAAMSSLQYSQTAPITEIVWVPAYNKIDKNGRIESLPADAPVESLTWQFATSCEDGTIAFWDLKWIPPEKVETGPTAGKKKKMVPRPKALLETISPFKVLDRVFKPDYKLTVQYPDEIRPVTLTTMNFFRPNFRKEEYTTGSAIKKDITARKYFRDIPSKQDYEMQPFILLGTAEGDLMRVTWEGYEFSTGMPVNNENARCTSWNRIHDGPITHAVRSKYLRNVILTVGGKVFALWREDVMDPVLWRKSSLRYTACCWGTFRPTVMLLARTDGTIEIWDILVKSEESNFTQSVSGRILTGIYTHELYLKPQCLAFCDYNGTMRVFCAPDVMQNYSTQDIDWFERYIDREIDRIHEFKEWQKIWSETNLENIERRKILAELEAERNRIEKEEKIRKEMLDTAAAIAAAKPKIEVRKPGQFLEEAKVRWKSMELRRMQRVILEKKGLRRDDLEKQRAPIMKLRKDARRKKRKIREILQQQDKIFEDTMAFLFPEQHYDRKPVELPQLHKEVEIALSDLAILQEVPQDENERKFASIEEEYIFQFLEVQAEALTTIQHNPYKHMFIWRKILSEGKLRRNTLDTQLKKRSKHRQRYLKYRGGRSILNVGWHQKSIREPGHGEFEGPDEGEYEEEGEEGEDEEDGEEYGKYEQPPQEVPETVPRDAPSKGDPQ